MPRIAVTHAAFEGKHGMVVAAAISHMHVDAVRSVATMGALSRRPAIAVRRLSVASEAWLNPVNYRFSMANRRKLRL